MGKTQKLPPSPQKDNDLPPPECISVKSNRIFCDGGGHLGHPRIWLEMGQNSWTECPYCSRRFLYKPTEK